MKLEYTVIAYETREMDEFTERVNYALADGWKCQGGVSICLDNENIEWIYQAMVKEVEDDED